MTTKRNIRHGVFETNSSSTHSICIPKEGTLELPKSLCFTLGQFGWECDTLSSIHEKARYLYTSLVVTERNEDIEKLKKLLEDKGIDATYEEPEDEDGDYWVDHSSNLAEFLNGIMSSEEQILQYLFSPLAFVLTGNDNDDEDVKIDVRYAHHNYYKGN